MYFGSAEVLGLRSGGGAVRRRIAHPTPNLGLQPSLARHSLFAEPSDTMSAPHAEPLLPADASSRDLEACASAPVPAPMHRLTGTFEDLALEAAFAALAF